MRILQVNQYYYPRGGADKYFLDLAAALEAAGEEVAVFAMDHPKNLATPWNKYFVSYLSFNQGKLSDKLRTPGRVIYSLETKRKFTKLIKYFRPDIIHIHNIYHHLSPSLLDVAARFKIPVVMHLHDYKLICPNHALFTKGTYCEQCRGGHYGRCLKNRCIKNSFSGSALAAIEMYFHHNILRIYENRIARFIAPSRFMKEMAIRFGQDGSRINVIYNSFNPSAPIAKSKDKETAKENFFLYFGRLSEEKGLIALIKAAKISGLKVKLAGEGPAKEELRAFAKSQQAPVEFLGFKAGQDLSNLISGARAVIIPSIWAENMPLSLLEALGVGQIAIVSRMGGLPEIVVNGKNGWLFEPGDEVSLIRQMEKAARLTATQRKKMSQLAKASVALLTWDRHLKQISAIYREVTGQSKK
jgi:glycosyltransferase involved in cell wall biosynthesis